MSLGSMDSPLSQFNPTQDRILDISPKQSDKIDLSVTDAIQATKSTNEEFKFLDGQPLKGRAGQLSYEHVDATATDPDLTVIKADVTGDGTADFIIGLRSLITLSAADFVLLTQNSRQKL